MYPLPHQPYPTRTLDTDERNLVRWSTNTLIAAALHDYDCFVKKCHGDVREDSRHDWKRIKHRSGLTVYRDRATHSSSDDDNIDVINENGSVSSQGPPAQIETFLCIGTIPGTLDDIMYGVVSPTAEDTMLKSSCIGDNIVDCCVLACVDSPTLQDPWRSLALKWAVNTSPVVVRPFIRPRDYTYVESTGITTSTDGERVGYHIINSVGVPDTFTIDEHALVRGNMSLYHVYRQKSPNTVEVHIRSFWQLNGRMHSVAQSYSCVEATLAIARIQKCSQMKKLAWLNQQSHSVDSQADPSCCSLCRRCVGGCFTVDKCCSVCQSVICWRCCASKRRSSYSPLKREVMKKRQTVCRRCVRKAQEPVVIQQPKPLKRSKSKSFRALSTVSTASLVSRDWNSSDRSRVCDSRV